MLPDARILNRLTIPLSPFGARLALLITCCLPPSLSCRPSEAELARTKAARAAIFTQALDIATDASRALPVRYSDDLGEGPGAWDPGPRLPEGTVNCTSWWQSVLAEAYARAAPAPWEPQRLKQRLLDLIRYHEGVPLFGYRRHFPDVALDPALATTHGPLRRVDLRKCGSGRLEHREVRPAFERWKKFAGYGCELRDEQLLRDSEGATAFDFLPLPALRDCMEDLDPDRRYAGFPVASPLYHTVYGKQTGPMGQVHGYLLRLREYPQKLRETRASRGAPLKQHYLEATHAKMSAGKVDTFVLWPDSAFALSLFSGIVLYDIDPDWNWRAELARVPAAAESEGARRTASCEARLPKLGGPKLFTLPHFMKKKKSRRMP